MSKSTKRKYVTQEVLHSFTLPSGQQKIVKVLAGCGNNLHRVVDTDGSQFLVSMPTKFRKNIWIKKGDYLIVEPIEEGDKVKAEIVTILYKDQISFIHDAKLWPNAFDPGLKPAANGIPDEFLPPSSSESDNDDGSGAPCRVINVNRPACIERYSESSSSEESDHEQDSCRGANR